MSEQAQSAEKLLVSSSSCFLVATVHKSVRKDSGCQVVSVDFKSVEDVHIVQFRNYYSLSISVFYKTFQSRVWLDAVIDFKLMSGGHCEQNAQTWFTLTRKHFTRNLERVSKIMIVLRQPALHWNKFGVHNLSLYYSDDQSTTDVSSGSSSLSELVSTKLNRMCNFDMAMKQNEHCQHYSDISLLATD